MKRDDVGEMSAKLAEKTRDVKFLNEENLRLMRETKDFRSTNLELRAKLEALSQTNANAAPGALNLSQPSFSSSSSSSASSKSTFKDNPFSKKPSSSILGQGDENAFPSSAVHPTNSISARHTRRTSNEHALGSPYSIGLSSARGLGKGDGGSRGDSAMTEIPPSLMAQAGLDGDQPDECTQS